MDKKGETIRKFEPFFLDQVDNSKNLVPNNILHSKVNESDLLGLRVGSAREQGFGKMETTAAAGRTPPPPLAIERPPNNRFH
ncbi:unnamed protein product [Linum trigynum]|uniref:Uncharacterized protein n=1 Tax=Linum trigynum TaxID=586398 RepID=A0AAV2EJQ4_9ROSI